MKIKYVPHYIIYDKKGELVNSFAPRPNEIRLNQLLEKYIKELVKINTQP